MPTANSFRVEFNRSEDLSIDILADIENIGGIINTAGTAVSFVNDFIALAESTADKLGVLAATLRVASLIPVSAVSTPASIALNGVTVTQQSIRVAEDSASALEEPLDLLDTALTRIALGVELGRQIVIDNIAVMEARNEGLDTLLRNDGLTDGSPAIAVGALDGQAGLDLLSGANDTTRDLLDGTEASRALFEELNLAVFSAFPNALEAARDTLEGIDRLISPLADALDEFAEAIEPFSSILESALAARDALLNEALDAVLEKTGLNELIEDLTEALRPTQLDYFSQFADQVLDELGVYDVAERTTDFWEELQILFSDSGPYATLNDIRQVEFEGPEGQAVLLGTNDGERLNPNDPFQNTDFVPLGGDDTVVGGSGTDRAWYTRDITDYRVEAIDGDFTGTRLRVSERAPGAEGEGTDLLSDVELLRFDTRGVGDITVDQVRRFEYVDDPDEPDLDGDDEENWLFGDGRANVLTGQGGEDRLFGAGGNDLLIGGAGLDSLFGGDGDDTLAIDARDGAEIDILDGGDGDDRVLLQTDAAVTVDFRTGGIDFGGGRVGTAFSVEGLVGTQFDDTYIGADGAQVVETGGGSDVFLMAGEGDAFAHRLGDTSGEYASISFAGGDYASGVRVEMYEDPDGVSSGTHSGVFDTTRAGDGNLDRLLQDVTVVEGTAMGDVFYALGSLDGDISAQVTVDVTIAGETFAVSGNAFLGGGGTDVFFGSELGNVFLGGEGFDLLNYSLDAIEAAEVSDNGVRGITVDFAAGTVTSRGVTGQDFGDDIFRDIEGVVGTRISDLFLGDDGDNVIYGFQGSDTILAGGGDDIINLTDLVNAEVDAGSGSDFVALGWSEDATVDGGDGIDTLDLMPGDTFRLDRFFEDQIAGEYANPLVLEGGWTVDLAAGTTAADFLRENAPAGTVPFTQENLVTSFENVLGSELGDTVTGSDGANAVFGRGGADSLVGAGGADILDGGADADTLSGGEGDDVLAGGAGDAAEDVLTGGGGADTFLLSPEGGADLIADFTPGTDSLSIEAFGIPVADVSLVDVPGAVNVVIDGTVVAVLQGVAAADIAPGDFLVAPPRAPLEIAGTEAAEQLAPPADEVPGTRYDIDAGGGDDTILGGSAEDRIQGGTGADSVAAGDGDDSVFGGGGGDTLRGGGGDDFVSGDAGADVLLGSEGTDKLLGGQGNDTLTPVGEEVARGGDGDDTFVITQGFEATGPVRIDGGGNDNRGDVLRLSDEAVVVENGDGSGTATLANGTVIAFEGIERVRTMPCFTPGTRVMTRAGPKPVEMLEVGDEVVTRDHGFRPIRWIGARHLAVRDAHRPEFRPVRIAQGALGDGPERTMRVSPRHRMLMRAAMAELHLGQSEVLVPALHLVGREGITQESGGAVTYIHLMFDSHEIVLADGVWSESFHPGEQTLAALSDAQREEIFGLFPDLATDPACLPPARPEVRRALVDLALG